MCLWVCGQSKAFFHSSPTGWKNPPLWRRCVVWLYVRCVPPVCWYIMPPQVVMIAVSGALGQCPTPPWWPPCCAMLAWHYFVAVGTRRWPKLKSWWRHTLPAMFRTLRSWPPCKWCFFFNTLIFLLQIGWFLLWWPRFSLCISQHQVLPVCDLWPGVVFLPLWYPAAGWGFLRHERRQADLRWIQEHPVWPLPQPDGESLAGGAGWKYDVRSLLKCPMLIDFNCKVECEHSWVWEFLERIMNYGWWLIWWHHIYHIENLSSCTTFLWPNRLTALHVLFHLYFFPPTVYHCDLHLGLHLAGSVCLHRYPSLILIQHGADLPQHQHPGWNNPQH